MLEIIEKSLKTSKKFEKVKIFTIRSSQKRELASLLIKKKVIHIERFFEATYVKKEKRK